ncbi:MAG: recombinase family protein [Pseudomonadota bacterium]|nr:recombinase family protein [Pseudomonadota bacterium]
MLKRVVLYYRVSTDKQDLHIQHEALQGWLAKRDPPPNKVYTIKDEGYSGLNMRRPGYRQVMQLAMNRKIDAIVVYRLDRFSRSASNAIRTLLDLDEFDVAFISVTQPIMSLDHENPFRRTILAAFAEIAQIERDTIVARVRAGLQAARNRGVRLGRPIKVDADAAAHAYRLRCEGKTYQQIADELRLSKGTIYSMVKAARDALAVSNHAPKDT